MVAATISEQEHAVYALFACGTIASLQLASGLTAWAYRWDEEAVTTAQSRQLVAEVCTPRDVTNCVPAARLAALPCLN